MPYIEQAARKRLASGDAVPQTTGELNYLLTKALLAGENEDDLLKICMMYYQSREVRNYAAMNDVIGAIAACIMEFMHRVDSIPSKVAALEVTTHVQHAFYHLVMEEYEAGKRETNGDVYP